MKNILIIILGILCIEGKSQIVPNWNWAKDAYGSDFGNTKVCTDIFGNNYVLGYALGDTIYSGTTTLTSPGNIMQIYIMKRDIAGNMVWAKSFGAGNHDFTYDIISNNNGDIYIAGEFKSPSITFGAFTLTNQGNKNMFLVKLDSLGNVLWAKCSTNVTGSISISASSLAVDGFGNIIVSGHCSDYGYLFGSFAMIANFGNGSLNIFLLKFDSNGNPIMAKTITGAHILPPNITSDANGNIYLASSYFQTSVTFDSFTIPAPQSWDVFVIKLDSSGNVLWAKYGGGNMEDYANDICSDASGNIYITGNIKENNGGATFDGTALLTYPGCNNQDVFLLKYDTNGNLIIAERMGEVNNDYGKGVSVDGMGNIFLTGQIFCDYYTNITVGTSFNYYFSCPFYGTATFVMKCDTSGNPLWIKYTQGGYSNAIAVDNFGNAYISGTYKDSSSIVFGSTTLTNPDPSFFRMFISKIGECMATSSTITQTTCHPYTLNGQTYDSTGVYTQTLTSSTGCDSIVTLNLTINYTYGSVTLTSCGGYSINGQSYNQTGIFHQIITNGMGCDSIFTINLTVPVYYTTINQTACNSFTLNNQTYISDGIYYQTLTSVSGCDSVITLHLNINTINPDIIVGTNILTADPPGAMAYQWFDCSNSPVPIIGATNQTYVIIASGNYAVMVTDNNGCTATSLCYAINIAGINEFSEENGILIFPNPLTSSASILLNKDEDYIISTTDIFGKEISCQKFSGREVTIEKGEKKPGVYFLRITDTDNNSINRKIIIQ